MSEPEFQYGPFARGIYLALGALVVPVAIYFPDYFLHYLAVLLFLGVGLKALLTRTGLARAWSGFLFSTQERWDRKYLEKHRRKIDRKIRDEKLRKSRVRDPRLPKNW